MRAITPSWRIQIGRNTGFKTIAWVCRRGQFVAASSGQLGMTCSDRSDGALHVLWDDEMEEMPDWTHP